MTEREDSASVERVERAVRDLLRGRSPRIGPADAVDRDAILAAVRLTGGREPFPRMAPGFRRRLSARLGAGVTGTGTRAFSRRAALVAAVAAAAGVAGGSVLGRTGVLGGALAPAGSTEVYRTRPRPIPAPPDVVQPAAAAARWFPAGPLAALPEGQARLFKAGSVTAFLFRSGSSVRAVSAICTHLPCELAWEQGNRRLLCPCHPRSFDEHGASVTTGDEYPLPTLPTVMCRVAGDGTVEVLGA